MNPGTDWIDQARRVLDVLRVGLDDAVPDHGVTAETDSPDCRWCPVCQVAAMVRGERPELTAALADVLTATATALRAFAAEADGAPSSDAGAAGDREARNREAGDRDDGDPVEETGGRPAPVVQRIEIA